ncbi:MAG: GNAT family N-acetyltransferase [Arenibacterium sp.]
MKVRFRNATREDVPTILALLRDDEFGAARETDGLETYTAAFERLAQETDNHLIVGEDEAGRLIATYQLTFISGLSHRGTIRAQVESVRVASDLRGQGVGHAMMEDAENRARAAGCRMMQLTTTKGRNRAADFYDALGFTPSHTGYKRILE